MQDFNPENERIKKQYFTFLAEADGKAASTIDAIRKAILRFETYNKFKSLKTFRKEQAIGFKNHLAKTKAKGTGEALSLSTVHATLNALKEFFKWLSDKPGYKKHINAHDIQYFRLTDKDARIATTPKFKTPPTIEQVRHVLQSMPTATEIQRRDRALIAFIALTGMRDSAVASLRLKHVDIASEHVKQVSGEVDTKFSKRIDTFFFPVGEDIKKIVLDWIKELREVHLYGEGDPVFPSTKIGHDENESFAVQGLDRKCWTSAAPIREIFKAAFTRAGLPYYNPHSFRHMLVGMGLRLCKGAEAFKVWSQNLGHDGVLTTLGSYGHVPVERQGAVIKELSSPAPGRDILKEALQERIDVMLKNGEISLQKSN